MSKEEREELAQKWETINALRETNELWVNRLEELSDQMHEIEEQTIANFLKQKSKEDRIAMKKLCENNPGLKAAQL